MQLINPITINSYYLRSTSRYLNYKVFLNVVYWYLDLVITWAYLLFHLPQLYVLLGLSIICCILNLGYELHFLIGCLAFALLYASTSLFKTQSLHSYERSSYHSSLLCSMGIHISRSLSSISSYVHIIFIISCKINMYLYLYWSFSQ